MIQTQQGVATPNATVYVSSLMATGGVANVDVALVPKGSGAILANIPDNVTAGGNKRGGNAVDLQMGRSANTQVASGSISVITGGIRNTAGGAGSVVSGGYSNSASGDRSVVSGGYQNSVSSISSTISGGKTNTAGGGYSVVSGGRANTASSVNSTVSGGASNNASATNSNVSGGSYNTASGTYSSISGGTNATTRGIFGMAAIASGVFGTKGDSQRGQYLLRGLTTDSTVKILTTNQSASGTTNQVILPNNSSYLVRGLINSHRTDVIGTSSTWQFVGCIRRGINAASTVLVGSTITVIAQDSGAMSPPPWAVGLSADTTNGCLNVSFTGGTGMTIRTVCLIETVEVTS